MSEVREEAVPEETFSVYGFALKIPGTWRVEFNPKGNRMKGDVVFHSPMRNRIFVSWGPLEDARRRFKSIEEQRDWGLKALKKSQNITSIVVNQSKETSVCGHKALVTRITASVAGGLLARKQGERTTSTVYLHCDKGARYYVLYSLETLAGEYPDFPALFESVAQSFVCHGQTSSHASELGEGTR